MIDTKAIREVAAVTSDSERMQFKPSTVIALLDRLEAAEKDAARLDYIESNCEGKLLRKYKKKWSFMPVCCNYEYPVFPNLRDALDYSMKEQK